MIIIIEKREMFFTVFLFNDIFPLFHNFFFQFELIIFFPYYFSCCRNNFIILCYLFLKMLCNIQIIDKFPDFSFSMIQLINFNIVLQKTIIY